jgi:hypothetical protein
LDFFTPVTCSHGHTKATTTGLYGVLPQGILSERVKMIEAVAYPGMN